MIVFYFSQKHTNQKPREFLDCTKEFLLRSLCHMFLLETIIWFSTNVEYLWVVGAYVSPAQSINDNLCIITAHHERECKISSAGSIEFENVKQSLARKSNVESTARKAALLVSVIVSVMEDRSLPAFTAGTPEVRIGRPLTIGDLNKMHTCISKKWI